MPWLRMDGVLGEALVSFEYDFAQLLLPMSFSSWIVMTLQIEQVALFGRS